MRTPANVARHPIHPMLVPIPIGLWIFSLVCDLIALASYSGAWPRTLDVAQKVAHRDVHDSPDDATVEGSLRIET